MPLPSGSDYDLDSGLAGLTFRNELNTILSALLSLNSSASLPPVTAAFMLRANTNTSPNQVEIRSSDDSEFLRFMQVTSDSVKLFSEGAAVPSLGVEQTFTEPQSIDVSGAAGSLTIASNQSSGVVARIPMIGHNSVGANTTGVNLVCRIETSTSGSEDFQFDIEVLRGGSTFRVLRLGSLTDFTRTDGSGTLNADVIQQAGVALAQIVREAKGRFENGGSFNTTIEDFDQADEGKMYRFNGSSNVTVRLNKLAQNTLIFFQNDSGTADITFAAAVSDPVTSFRTPRLTLPGISGQSPTCAVHWYLADGSRVNIIGDNVES